MGKWFPYLYDVAMKPLEKTRFNKIRTELVGEAKGRVLEIGSGTGVNFPYYKNAIHVDAIEPNPLMSKKALKRMQKSKVPIELYSASAEELPFADSTFDTVVSTLVFCTILDPFKALKEIRRVSKTGAEIVFFEHVRMDQPLLGKTQDVLTPLWKKGFDGCHLNRNTLEVIKESGLEIKNVDSNYGGLFLTIECLN
ncbi:class I SAM-dependent methyltransferase [Sporosarcina sp. FA9]|uniref:class I SAM-dependent methyltransferase n=1 Tax=Sporosarcina sp. FA9 TaxID=3413030 RepID=UPI003F658F6E